MNLLSKTRLKLANKIMVAFVVTFLLILLTYSTVIFIVENIAVRTFTKDYALQVTSEEARNVKTWLEERQMDLVSLSKTDEIMNLEKENYMPMLQSVIKEQSSVFGNFFVIDPAGDYTDTLGINENVNNLEDYKVVAQNVKDLVISSPKYSNVFKQATVIMAMPIMSNGNVVGTIGATILLQELSTQLSEVKVKGSGYAFLIDSAGNVIAHPNNEYVLNQNIFADTVEGFKGLEKIGNALENKLSGTGTYYDHEGFKKYAAYQVVDDTSGWSIVVTSFSNKLFGGLKNLLILMVSMSVFLCVLVVVVANFIAKDITKPIDQLIKIMSMFSKGNKGVRASVGANDEIGQLSEAFNEMAETIITQTDNVEELIKERTQTLADLNYQIVSRNNELNTMNKELEVTNDRLHHLASTDMLTALNNRHQLLRDLQRTIDLCNAGEEQNFSVLFVDLDNFKYYNDTFSHEIGDFLLQEVSKILKASVREMDLVGRYGGDEFVIILKQGNFDTAKDVAVRVHENILGKKGYRVELERKLGTEILLLGKNMLSCSIGIVNYMKSLNITSAEELLKLADETMYLAKKQGKSRIVVK